MMVTNSFVQILLTLIVVIAAQLIIRDTLGRMVHRLLRGHKYESAAEKHRREDTLIRVFRTLSGAVLWTVGIIVILGELHVHLATLLTGAGLIGVVVGLGAQNVLKDYLAGILIITENQFRVGDIVSMSAGMSTPVAGVVEDISIRATRLRDLDGNLHIVPNGSAGVITNLSFKFAQVNVDVGVALDSDIDQVEKIINQVGSDMANEEPWSEHIIEPIQFLRLDNFSESSLVIKSVGKVQPATQWNVAGEFRRRLKLAFQKNGVQLAMPQVVVHETKHETKKSK
jgi:small conductance mechanosensitive channel